MLVLDMLMASFQALKRTGQFLLSGVTADFQPLEKVCATPVTCDTPKIMLVDTMRHRCLLGPLGESC
jgi:hypothetical protein